MSGHNLLKSGRRLKQIAQRGDKLECVTTRDTVTCYHSCLVLRGVYFFTYYASLSITPTSLSHRLQVTFNFAKNACEEVSGALVTAAENMSGFSSCNGGNK